MKVSAYLACQLGLCKTSGDTQQEQEQEQQQP